MLTIFRSSSVVRFCRPLASASLLLILLLFGNDCLAAEFHNALSLQGFTGILNTPNAAVTKEGRFYALYSDQMENGMRSRLKTEDSYMFSVGLFDIVEVGGRLTEAPRKKGPVLRDLSGNFKVKVPFIPKEGYLPQVAVGFQDQGGNGHLDTKYLVASKDIWRLRLSAGYGTGPGRMDGAFGGVELRTCDWLYLLGEYDTRETNLGLRLVTPEFFGVPVNVQFTAKTSLNHNPASPEFGVGLQFPLGLDHHNRAPARKTVETTAPTARDEAASNGSAATPESTVAVSASEPDRDRRRTLERLKERLAADGFQNLQVGEGAEGRLLVVEYENSRYNHNELDGIGVVAGIIADNAPTGFRTVRLVLKKKGIRMLQLSAPFEELAGFMENADGLERLRDSLEVRQEISGNEGVNFVSGASNPSWLRPTLVLAPGLKTFVGTEVSPFDYLLSLKPELFVPLWKGAVIDARWDIPLAWSDNFDDRKSFRSSRNSSRLERLMLFQAVKLAPTLMANLGAGEVLPHQYGTLNELLWSPGDATHRFGVRQSYLEDSRNGNARTEVYLGSYRYRYAPLDLSLELTGGRFFFNDTGALVELKRYFGDTLFSFFYKDVDTAEKRHLRAGGVQFVFPLTPRRDMKATVAQVKGIDNWSYAQETVISGRNSVDVPPLAVNPVPAYNISDVFHNRDRLSEAYVKMHLLRLRDAYLRYVSRPSD